MASVFTDHSRIKPPKTAEAVPSSASALGRTSMFATHLRSPLLRKKFKLTAPLFLFFTDYEIEIRKRYVQPLAVESGEFPDVSNIEARMLPMCYEAGLLNGHVPDAAQFMSIATETFIKEVMSQIFSRTRSNGPGDSGNAGFGPGGGWVQTHKYKRKLAKEEEAAQRGEVTRDKSGLLPIEAKMASERGPLGMADLRIALEMGDCGMANFPIISKNVIYNYREGELENWDDYTWMDGRESRIQEEDGDVEMGGVSVKANGGVNGSATKTDSQLLLPNGVDHDGAAGDPMDVDDELPWEGADPSDRDYLDGVLDSCLAVG